MAVRLQTNRDLYLAIEELSQRQADCARSLESYLLAVLDLSGPFAERDSLSLSEMYDMLAGGFDHSAAMFSEDWRDQYDRLPHQASDYSGWRATVIRQVVDLHEMAENGTLKNEMRYFGVRAPRQSYWYNFDPRGYLECAMAGSFGGWEPGDDTGREYVSGPVAVLAENGSIPSANPEDLHNPIYQIHLVTWDQFKDFVICGQIYE